MSDESEVDVATQGNRKTGGITGHPINANLVDQYEWCTIEINQQNGTTILLNDIPILTVDNAPTINGDRILIRIDDAEVSLRRVYLKVN